ncbi:MAG: hypothetical protein CM15mP95_3340 [Alphaproteobacteria bacterium]|nr:MAG: hypothetical protein CM15mP95_3340 [Alphaproteobacteria bacterium]
MEFLTPFKIPLNLLFFSADPELMAIFPPVHAQLA